MRNLYIGLMSGTSMDGIDAALVDINTLCLIDSYYFEYDASIKTSLKKITQSKTITLDEYSFLDKKLGSLFAHAANILIKKSQIEKSSIRAIGSHGQTIKHAPNAKKPYTVQIACPSTIAYETGIDVVADFRQKDLCNGGQGAPFAPIFHQLLFHDATKNRALVNLGGISNISFIAKSGNVFGFDTGPGNCLMDLWVNTHLANSYDCKGLWAKKGKVSDIALTQLLDDPYFTLQAPKSIDKEYFSLSWLESKQVKDYEPEDIQATLLELTVQTISSAINDYFSQCDELIVCGGGVHNEWLMKRLTNMLSPINVFSMAHFGINADFIEAMMFAWLAHKTIVHEKIDLTSITGSNGPVILGGIYNS
jgi:anhydro-N-acetylmuramic acid kinase